jgi:ribosomal protein L18
MRQRRRVAITIETSRLVVRRSMSHRDVWCAQCAAHVQSVTREDAAALAGVSPSMIYTQTELGEYHFVHEVGSNLICLNSLFASMNKTRP